MTSSNGDGRHAAGAGQARRRRTVLIVGLIALALLAFGGGYLLAKSGSGSSPSPTPTQTRSPKPTKEPTVTPSPSESASASASASPSGSPVLEDGRHFVYPKDATAAGTWSLTFDLAYFYTDEDAIRECGPDVPNGYCIVNDNPKLRTLPVSRNVAVRYIPVDACCALRPGNFPSFAVAVEAGTRTTYDSTTPYWITVQAGQVVRISQQFLP